MTTVDYLAHVAIPLEDGPALAVASHERVEPYTAQSGPFGQGLRFAAYGDAPSVTPVAALLGPCGPSNVSWFVVPVYVDAVKAVIGSRARADVADKRGEVVEPFVAHTNTACSVPLIVRIVDVVAARLGGSPRSVFRRAAPVRARASAVAKHLHILPQ